MEEVFSNPQDIMQQVSIQEGSNVADIGTGVGFYALLLSECVGSGGSVFAIDIHKHLLEKLDASAKEKGFKNITTIWGNIESTNGSRLRDASIDFVVVANVLFQLEDKVAGIKELNRILKVGGVALVVDWTESFNGLGPHKDHVVSKDQAQNLFEAGGFSKTKEIKAGKHHYGIVFTKNNTS